MSFHRTLIRLSALLAVVALAKGCGDGDSPSAPPMPEPARPTTVTVSPATTELTVSGATVQLSAEVRDQNSNVMAAATVTWTSSAGSVATVNASGLVTGVAEGTATITASAGSAQGTAQITVAGAEGGFRDDFVPGSLSDWEIEEGTRAEISEGILRVTSLTEGGGFVLRFLESPITSWEARIRLARADRRAPVGVALGVPDEGYRSYFLVIGPPFVWEGVRLNYFFGLLDDQSNFHDDIVAVGYSDAIGDGDGEFMEVSIALKDGELTGHAGAAELFTFQVPATLPASLNGVGFGPVGAGIWDVPPGQTALFDWIEVRGIRGGGTASADRTNAAERTRKTPNYRNTGTSSTTPRLPRGTR